MLTTGLWQRSPEQLTFGHGGWGDTFEQAHQLLKNLQAGPAGHTLSLQYNDKLAPLFTQRKRLSSVASGWTAGAAALTWYRMAKSLYSTEAARHCLWTGICQENSHRVWGGALLINKLGLWGFRKRLTDGTDRLKENQEWMNRTSEKKTQPLLCLSETSASFKSQRKGHLLWPVFLLQKHLLCFARSCAPMPRGIHHSWSTFGNSVLPMCSLFSHQFPLLSVCPSRQNLSTSNKQTQKKNTHPLLNKDLGVSVQYLLKWFHERSF